MTTTKNEHSKAAALSNAQGFTLFGMSAFSHLQNIGDIFTDAPECAASVATVRNLIYLASTMRMRNQHIDPGFLGVLCADGQAVCEVTIFGDGSMNVQLPENFDSSERKWTVRLETADSIAVAFFAGECSDDETWVIDDAQAFYAAVINA